MSVSKEQVKEVLGHEKNKTVLSGFVKAVKSVEVLGEEAVLVQYKDILVNIPRSELAYEPVKGTLLRFIGRTVDFVIDKIDQDNRLIIGTRKALDEAARDDLAKEMEDGVTKLAIVTNPTRFGAFVEIEGHNAFLRNQELIQDGSRANDVVKRGDRVTVKLNEYTEDKKLHVEATQKKVDEEKIRAAVRIKELENTPILGEVINITDLEFGKAVFVEVEKGIHALASYPDEFDVEVGDKVVIKLTEVNVEKNRIRGPIISKSYHQG